MPYPMPRAPTRIAARPGNGGRRIPGRGAVLAGLAEQEAQLLEPLAKRIFRRHGEVSRGLRRGTMGVAVGPDPSASIPCPCSSSCSWRLAGCGLAAQPSQSRSCNSGTGIASRLARHPPASLCPLPLRPLPSALHPPSPGPPRGTHREDAAVMSFRPGSRIFSSFRPFFRPGHADARRRASTAAGPGGFAGFWNSPIGPKTVHFWCVACPRLSMRPHASSPSTRARSTATNTRQGASNEMGHGPRRRI
jgi:hypothetical protein